MQWSCNAPIHEIHIVLIKKTGLRLIEETELKKSMRRQLALWSMSSIECRSNASLPILSTMNVVVARLSVNCIIVSNRIITGACTMRFDLSARRTLTRYEKQLNWLAVLGIIDDTLLSNYLLTTTYQSALDRLPCLQSGSILFFGPFCRRA